ncbi:DUF1345 domain-containing protein [Roseateles violae]|uniref:DUF1345 domain-containing protein n=1 Tax=Roseateles violae TaxID=3058042 RepID=A0ABT8DY29_9BURK|nr:DUF1345 domain-containing protein [Pelomonas sp. PFR6]MDN3921856.1 DUF1345 domain-containing protein [Pelomonas sp. PFR6]
MSRAPAALNWLRLRPRLSSAIVAGLLLGLLWPAAMPVLTRCLIGWTGGVWLYLLLALHMMLRADHAHLQRNAKAQADSIGAVLLLAIAGAIASLGAIALELAQLRPGLAAAAWPHLLLAIATVSGSWLLLPVEFALAYASLYHRGKDTPHGLEFPGDEADPDYMDFMYFSVTIAATSQTSDVAVSARPMRRLVLLHAALSFVFNTSVLALTINLLAGLFS